MSKLNNVIFTDKLIDRFDESTSGIVNKNNLTFITLYPVSLICYLLLHFFQMIEDFILMISPVRILTSLVKKFYKKDVVIERQTPCNNFDARMDNGGRYEGATIDYDFLCLHPEVYRIPLNVKRKTFSDGLVKGKIIKLKIKKNG